MIWNAHDRAMLSMDKMIGLRTRRVLRAEAVEQFGCPECRVPAGAPCRWSKWGWSKENPHKERLLCAALVNGGVTA
jgi:hypothetical protein